MDLCNLSIISMEKRDVFKVSSEIKNICSDFLFDVPRSTFKNRMLCEENRSFRIFRTSRQHENIPIDHSAAIPATSGATKRFSVVHSVVRQAIFATLLSRFSRDRRLF